MLSRGQQIVLAILLLAVGLAVVNMLFQMHASRRAVAYWGREASRLILTAHQAQILRLEPLSAEAADEKKETAYLDVGGRRFAIADERDLSKARGALHFRRALVTDDLYDWQPAGETPPQWRRWCYALRFREGNAELTLLLAEGCTAVATLTDGEPLPVRANNTGSSPLAEFVDEQFPR